MRSDNLLDFHLIDLLIVEYPNFWLFPKSRLFICFKSCSISLDLALVNLLKFLDLSLKISLDHLFRVTLSFHHLILHQSLYGVSSASFALVMWKFSREMLLDRHSWSCSPFDGMILRSVVDLLWYPFSIISGHICYHCWLVIHKLPPCPSRGQRKWEGVIIPLLAIPHLCHSQVLHLFPFSSLLSSFLSFIVWVSWVLITFLDHHLGPFKIL